MPLILLKLATVARGRLFAFNSSVRRAGESIDEQAGGCNVGSSCVSGKCIDARTPVDGAVCTGALQWRQLTQRNKGAVPGRWQVPHATDSCDTGSGCLNTAACCNDGRSCTTDSRNRASASEFAEACGACFKVWNADLTAGRRTP